MNSHDLDDLIQELNRTEPHIDDDGFTRAVMAELPATRGLSLRARNLIQVIAVLIGSAIFAAQLAVFDIPFAELVTVSYATVQSVPLVKLLPVLAVMVMMPFIMAMTITWITARELV